MIEVGVFLFERLMLVTMAELDGEELDRERKVDGIAGGTMFGSEESDNDDRMAWGCWEAANC